VKIRKADEGADSGQTGVIGKKVRSGASQPEAGKIGVIDENRGSSGSI
jgi:hypothetical protein